VSPRRVYRYGPIYGIELGPTSAVVLNNMCAISEALESKGHIFSDRPNWLPLISMVYRERGEVRLDTQSVRVITANVPSKR